MPWLVGTAFIHSIQMQERRGMLKAWNVALIMVAFFLSIFGTFVVRSGILARSTPSRCRRSARTS